MTHAPTRTPISKTHPLTGLPLVPLGMSKRGPIWPILGGDDTVPPTPTPPAGGTDPATLPPSSGETPPAGGTAPPEAKFSQADLDRILTDRLGKEQARYKAELEALQATAGKSDLEAANIKLEQSEKARQDAIQASSLRVAQTEAKLAANLAGARPDRLSAVLAQADLSAAVDKDGNVDDAKVASAVAKVLEDFPEWKTAPGAGLPAASGSELPPGGGTGHKPTYTRAQITEMSAAMKTMDTAKAKEQLAEINAAMAEGRIKG